MLVLKETPSKAILIFEDNSHLSFDRDHPNYQDIKDKVVLYNSTKDLTVRKECKEQLGQYTKTQYETVLTEDGRLYKSHGQWFVRGNPIPIEKVLAARIQACIDNNLDFDFLINFWNLASLNLDVKDQLFSFLVHNGHPITKNGYFIAYKAVQIKEKYDPKTGELIKYQAFDEDTGEQLLEDFSCDTVFAPFHQGPYGNIIKLGVPVTMPREECDADSNRTCSTGLHVGSMQYVRQFGHNERIILQVLVDPRNVVAVPADYNNTKMRVCEYYPIALVTKENDKIYLEEDYINYSKSEVQKQIAKLEVEKQTKIAELDQTINVLGNLF